MAPLRIAVGLIALIWGLWASFPAFADGNCPFPSYRPRNTSIKPCGSNCMSVNPEVAEMLEKAVDAFGKGAIVTDGCRSIQRNISYGGTANDSHVKGNAIDSVPASGSCEPYKAIAEQVNGRKFLPCNHGTGPHLHIDIKSPPCQNCQKDNPEDYKRKDKPQDQAGSPGLPSAPTVPASGGGGSSPSVDPPAEYPTRRRTEAELDRLFRDPPRSATASLAEAKLPSRNAKIPARTDLETPSQITSGKSGATREFTGEDTKRAGASRSGRYSTPGNGSYARSGTHSNGDGSSGASSFVSPHERVATSESDREGSAPSGSLWGMAGGRSSGGGGLASPPAAEVTTSFSKSLGAGKMGLAGAEGEAFNRSFEKAMENMGSSREPAASSPEEESLFQRCHEFYRRCQLRGCVAPKGML